MRNREVHIGGIGPWRIDASQNLLLEPYVRWTQAFVPDTVMTPISQADIDQNPEAILIDFLPSGSTLFGQQGDGTVGPLGFGKILVKSGELDRCAVQRIYERFVGRRLDPTMEAGFIEALAAEFVSQNRSVRAFVRSVMHTPDFRRGL